MTRDELRETRSLVGDLDGTASEVEYMLEIDDTDEGSDLLEAVQELMSKITEYQSAKGWI